MGSIAQAKSDLTDLSERIRTVAEALRRLPAGQAPFPDEIDDLREEVQAIAAELRGNRAAQIAKRVVVLRFSRLACL